MKRICFCSGYGRFGNLMFQIATGIRYSRENDMQLMIVPYNGDKEDDPDFFYSYYKSLKYGIFNEIQMEIQYHPRDAYMLIEKYQRPIDVFKQNNYEYLDIPSPGEDNNMFLIGYFQNPRYFSRELALELFSPDKNIVDYIHSLYNGIDFSNLISIHIRRTDFLSKECQDIGYVVNDMSFYKALFSLFNKDQKYIIVSDDIDWCKENFIGDNFIFADRHSEDEVYSDQFIDMYIQTICKHNIISNSTFSWWGAYLNQNPNRKVFFHYPWWRNNDLSNEIIPKDNNWKKVIYED